MKKVRFIYLVFFLIPVWGLLIYGIKSPQNKSNAIRISADSTFAPGQYNQWRKNGIYSWEPSLSFIAKRKLSLKSSPKNNSLNNWNPLISIDTSKIVEANFFQISEDFKISKTICQAYRVKLENNGFQSWKLGGYENSLPLYQEALNESGNWVRIENPESIGCTSQSLFIEILSGESITTTLPLYEGEYQTKIRLAWTGGMVKVISNSFTGRINKEQFLKTNDSENIIISSEK